jgi:hypothetical protein
VWLLTILLLSIAPSDGAPKKYPPRATLRLSAEPPSGKYIVLKLLITNQYRGPHVDASALGLLAGPDELHWSSCPGPITVFVTRKNGDPVPLKPRYDRNPAPPDLPLCSRNVLEKLAKGATAMWEIPLIDLAHFQFPGIYKIRFRAQFGNLIVNNGIAAPYTVFSNSVNVTIAP